MKRLLTFSLISLLVCSCRHRCKTYTRVGNHKEINDLFFFFKKGSFWVSKDSLTNINDTLKASIVDLHLIEYEGPLCEIKTNYSVSLDSKNLFDIDLEMFKGTENHVNIFGIDAPHPYKLTTVNLNETVYDNVLQLKKIRYRGLLG